MKEGNIMKKVFALIAFPGFWKTMLPTIIALIVGILLTAKPDILELTCIAIGSLLAIAGLGMLLYFLIKKPQNHVICVYAVLFMAGGALLGIVPTLLKFLIPIFFGAWLLTSSAAGMYNNYMLRYVHPFWWLGLLLCTAGAAIGLYVITRPATIMESTVRLIGIAMIVHSALRLLSLLFGGKYQHQLAAEAAADEDDDGIIEITIKE